MTKEFGTAYGVYIDIDGPTEDLIAIALTAPAEKTIEVAVRYRGVTKEFTLADFFERLGFHDQDAKVCSHEWVVFSTALEDRCLMMECKLCKARGTVDDPTKDEWNAAFRAPSSPYTWEGGYERVNIQEE